MIDTRLFSNLHTGFDTGQRDLTLAQMGRWLHLLAGFVATSELLAK